MKMKKRFLSILLSLVMVLGLMPGISLTAQAGSSEGTAADLVVYGKIFTSENGKVAEAFAVKDGKYVYVGDKAGAAAFVEQGKTEVLDYTGKGLVMPSCGNGHAHYSSSFAIQTIGTIIGGQDGPDKFLTEILPTAVEKARNTGAKAIFGFG
jgi:predicted amidohydrolase YtcJ